IVSNRQDACSTKDRFSCGTIVSNRQDACSTKDQFSCGTGILPVHRMLVENGIIL
ncbi:MAG: helix-hairpin-helix domain-containing protein, partial [Oscillatoriales cyanobacterium]